MADLNKSSVKKFNWGKACGVFFTLVLFGKGAVYLFGNKAPACDSTEVKHQLISMIGHDLTLPQFRGFDAEFKGHEQLTSGSNMRTCKATLIVRDRNGGSGQSDRFYEIVKKENGFEIKLD